ncbi:uncharacterized protein LOC143188359 [Calliopsis andreniformis]|uniref:uncharacterized protein LOC143188359 n=1 Tax=Calliopsis andreniformis TaxID=337506 RepID=UPI003FCEC801
MGFRISTRIWSRELRRQLESITDSSLEPCCGTTKVVQAQIEANPRSSVSNSHEASKLLKSKRSSHGSVFDQGYLNDEKGKKISSVVANKLKNLKKTLICPRLAMEVEFILREKLYYYEIRGQLHIRTNKSLVFTSYETDETQRLNLPIPSFNHRSPAEQSTLFQKNHLDNVSTSTRISANVSDARRQNDEILTKHDNLERNNETPLKLSEDDYSSSKKEELQEIVSLIKRQSVNGKSVCDVRISGLMMNQSELLELFEATRGETRSASIVTTEEASIISIKFHRHSSSHKKAHEKDSSFFEDSLRKLYKSLPERLEDLSPFKVFRSQERSGPSNRVTPTIQVSDHSSRNKSKNETSYMSGQIGTINICRSINFFLNNFSESKDVCQDS